jgi:thioredoxin 2
MAESRLLRCPTCGAVNRVPLDKLEAGRQPVCGRCKNPLPARAAGDGARPMTVTDASFVADVERSAMPVLLDAWAPWCGPCRMIAPVVDQLATELAGRARVAKLNIDENPVTAQRLDVRSIPMLLVFKGGREVDRIVGVQPKSEIARRVERAIA